MGRNFRTVILLGVVVLLVVGATPSGNAAEPSASDKEIRAAVNRSLPYLEKHGVSWIENKKCVSCHRIGVMTRSFQEAQRRGFEVDGNKLDEWLDWSLSRSLEKREKDNKLVGSANLEGLAELILGRDDDAGKERTTSYVAFTDIIAAGQREDGAWKPSGQLPFQKRPLAETTQVSAMWLALAMGSVDKTSEAVQESRNRAIAWLKQAKPGKSTEWYLAFMLLKYQLNDKAASAEMQKQLRRLQNDDGGWGWLSGDKSDALATGQSLYALRSVGVPSDDPAVQKAVAFLLRTQSKNGSWPVPGTKEKKKGSVQESATYWGTGWATIGLLQTLP